MLGRAICDPHGMEGEVTDAAGLGLLDIETTLTDRKTLTRVHGQAMLFEAPFQRL